MQFVSRVAGKTAPITVERQHGHYIDEVAGVRHEVDTRALGPWVLSLLVEGQSHGVAVVRLGDGSYSVDWRGRSFAVELPPAPWPRGRPSMLTQALFGDERLLPNEQGDVTPAVPCALPYS